MLYLVPQTLGETISYQVMLMLDSETWALSNVQRKEESQRLASSPFSLGSWKVHNFSLSSAVC